MQERFDMLKLSGGAVKAMLALEQYLHSSGLDEGLIHMLKLRASQINGCAYCIDMHWKDARAVGETEQRLYGLNAWEESRYYNDRERAALAWIEAVTRISETHAPDDVYENLQEHFNEKEISDLTVLAAVINSWNRMSIASRKTAGDYAPPKLRAQKTA